MNNYFQIGISLWKFSSFTHYSQRTGMVSPGVLQSDIKDPHGISLVWPQTSVSTSFQYKKTGMYEFLAVTILMSSESS